MEVRYAVVEPCADTSSAPRASNCEAPGDAASAGSLLSPTSSSQAPAVAM